MPTINTSKISAEIASKYSVVNNSFRIVSKDDPKDLVVAEIGDTKQTDFLPQMKICRWGNSIEDNECNVSIRLKGFDKYTVETEGEKVKLITPEREAHFYDIAPNEEHPEGAREFEIVLKEPPKSNVIEFTLNDKDVDYFYQPALTAEEIEQVASRPENVEGSYAIYAKTPKTNWIGGKEFRCGKVGHIYRPKIEDANGDWIWGELNIDSGILSVTIPQEFLDNAVYPIRHAAGLTFGYTTVGASKNFPLPNRNYMVGPKYAGADGTLVSMSAYVKCDGNMQLAIYDTSAVASMVDHTENIALNSLPKWVTGNVVVGASTSSVDYHLLENHSSSSSFYWNWDSGPNCYGASQTFGIWPATVTLSEDTYLPRKYSIYATYTAGGGTVVKDMLGGIIPFAR